MRKNVLIIAHSYGLPFLESCNQYAQLFDTKRYHVTVLFLIGKECSEITQKALAEKVIFLNLANSALKGLKISAIAQLIKICRKQTFDAVICNRYKPAYLMLWVAQFCRIKLLLFIMHAPETMKSVARKLLMYALMRKKMFLVGVSNAIQTDLRDDLPLIKPEKILSFYNIINPEQYYPAFIDRETARQALGITEQVYVFGYIARLVKDKDPATLINAFALLESAYPTARLVIIGNGKLEQSLKQMVATLRLEQKIIFTGYVDNGFKYMKAFDTFVLPSVSEAFGRVLLEAMIAKIPIIATRVEGIPEVMGQTGMLIEPREPQQLSDAMQRMMHLTPQQKNQIVTDSYQRLQDNFTFTSFEKNFWQSPAATFL